MITARGWGRGEAGLAGGSAFSFSPRHLWPHLSTPFLLADRVPVCCHTARPPQYQHQLPDKPPGWGGVGSDAGPLESERTSYLIY